MKTEADLNHEFIKPEGYVSNRELVVPSLLPFLTEDTANMDMLKRNQNEKETNRHKINQKRIESELGSSTLLNAASLLEEWSYLVRDDEDRLTCAKEMVLPTLFNHFHELNKIINEFNGDDIPNEIVVPTFKKPATLRLAFDVYQKNYETIKKVSLGFEKLLKDILTVNPREN